MITDKMLDDFCIAILDHKVYSAEQLENIKTKLDNMGYATDNSSKTCYTCENNNKGDFAVTCSTCINHSKYEEIKR
jgi:hypothetical protein